MQRACLFLLTSQQEKKKTLSEEIDKVNLKKAILKLNVFMDTNFLHSYNHCKFISFISNQSLFWSNKAAVNSTRISNPTNTTQSRSMATPNANPASLSIAPAATSAMNQGLRTMAVEDAWLTFLRAYMTSPADIN